MRAGNLDRPLVYFRLEQQPQTDGSRIEAPVKFGTGWGTVKVREGQDTYGADQRRARQALQIEARYHPGVEPRMLVSMDGTTYEIEDVAVLDRNERVMLTCHAYGVPAGGG